MAVVISKRSFMFHFLRWGYKAAESNPAGGGAVPSSPPSKSGRAEPVVAGAGSSKL